MKVIIIFLVFFFVHPSPIINPSDNLPQARKNLKTNEQLQFDFISTCKDEDFFKPVKKGMSDAAALMGVNCLFTGTQGVNLFLMLLREDGL